MPQNADTLTLQATRRNLRVRMSARFLIIFLLILVAPLQISFAQQDPFSEPLKSLNKIEPANVVQFRLVKTTTNGGAGSAELELETRGGFKIYDHGLRFEYRSPATLDSLIPLKVQAEPPAKVVQDPFYNEPRAIHDKGARFLLSSDVPLDETGFIRVRFEACSVNTCLLPAYFLIPSRTGQTSRPEPKANPLVNAGGLGAQSSSDNVNSALSSGLSSSEPLQVKPTSNSSPQPAPKISVTPANTPTVFSTPTQATIQPSTEKEVSLTDSITSEVQKSLLSRSWLLFPALFLAGLLMNLTPCVYPMIPITLNILSRIERPTQDGSSPHTRNFIPALMYMIGIILSYASMGVIAGMTGSLFGGLLQSKLVNAGLALLMFVFGLSMLGVIDLSKIQNAASRIPVSRKSPHLAEITMGAVSGLVAAPCTGPVLSMLLLLVGQTRDPVYGFTLMSIFAAGFSAPYLVLGMLSQQFKRLPKAGSTMNLVKHVFAALMFSLALYYLKPLVQGYLPMTLLYIKPSVIGLLTIAILTGIFVFLMLRDANKPIYKIAVQTGLTILSLWFALWAIKGFIAGEIASLPSLSRINDPVEIPKGEKPTGERIIWYKDWNKAVQAATLQNKGLIVDAWAQWCAACLKMDAEVWNEPGVEALIDQHFIALKVDFTESNPQSEELTKRWDLSGLPAVGIYPAKSDFMAQPAILFREALTVSTFHQSIQKLFNGELTKQ